MLSLQKGEYKSCLNNPQTFCVDRSVPHRREIVHHLIRVLDPAQGGREPAAAELVAKLGAKAEVARELCYRLYIPCERKKRAAEALAYNGLVQSWPEIARRAQAEIKVTPAQPDLV